MRRRLIRWTATALPFVLILSVLVALAGPASPRALAIDAEPGPVPGVPFVTDVFARDSAVRVSWSPPDTGVQGLTGYEITADPGGAVTTAGPDATEAIVTGPANGIGYTFTVTAVNGNGRGRPSPPSAVAVPRPGEKPLRPRGLLAIALDGRIDVQWVAPEDGGTPITGYTVKAEPGAVVANVAADTTVASLSGLTNGTPYTVSVTAANKAGTSDAATQTGLTPTAARAPAAPTDVNAGVVADGAVQVTWSPPVDAGTADIGSYTVTESPGGATATATTTTATVRGLDPAIEHTFTVTAANPHGTSPASAGSRAVLPKLTTKATPKVLSEAAMNALRLAHPDGTLDFAAPPPEVTALRAGDLIVAPAHAKTPQGLFRKVTTVRPTGGLVIVATEEAALTEAIGDGAFSSARAFDTGNIERADALTPGFRIKEPTIRGRTARQGGNQTKGINVGLRRGKLVVEIETTVGQPDTRDPSGAGIHGAGGRIEGQFELELHGDFGATFSLTDGLRTHAELSAKYKGALRAKVGFVKKLEREYPGFRLRNRCFNVQVGPVPIIICLDLHIRWKVEVDGSIGFTSAVEVERRIGARVEGHNNDFTTTGVNEGVQSGGLHPYGDTTVTATLPIALTLYFYNYAGPGIMLQPYGQFKIDTTQDPWWELRAGVRLGVFFKTRKLFGIEIDYAKEDVINWFVTILEAGGPFSGLKITPKEANTDPGEPVQFTASVVPVNANVPITWSVEGGPGTIDGNGVFSSPYAGTASIKAHTPGDGTILKSDAKAGVTIAGTTVPSAPREPQAAAGPLSAVVRWTPPVTNGGSPLTGYVVTSTPPAATAHVPPTDNVARIRGLKPDVSYSFQIYAVNAVGTGPPSAVTAAVTPLDSPLRLGVPTELIVDEFGRPDRERAYHFSTISGDGRYVFFEATGTSNLAPEEVYGQSRTFQFRKDLATGEIVVASRDLDGRTPIPVSSTGGTIDGEETSIGVDYDGTVSTYSVRTTTGWALMAHDSATAETWPVGDGLARIAQDPRVSRDGRTFAFHTYEDSTVNLWMHTRGGDGPKRIDHCGTTKCIATTDGLAMSADGRWVVYTGSNGTNSSVFVYDASSGTRADLRSTTTDMVRFNRPRISPDGTTVAVGYHQETSRTPVTVKAHGVAVKQVGAGPIVPSDIVVTTATGGTPHVFATNTNGKVIAYGDIRPGAIWDARIRDGNAGTVQTLPPEVSGVYKVGPVQMSHDGLTVTWSTTCATCKTATYAMLLG